MEAKAANLLKLLNGPKQFVIPIYQRTYSWQISQCEKLLSDILRISKDNSVPGHFIGSIVYFQESLQTVSDVPQLLVIDGQQRLTTISLMIFALAEFLDGNKEVEIDTSPVKLRNYYLLNSEESGELRYKLFLTRRDKETLINLLKNAPTNEPSLRVFENLNFFKEKITVENAAAIYAGIQRLFVVDVALEKDKDNPQLIFESLNSTGLDLSQADLIRNFILMGQPIAIQTDLYERYWYPMEQSFGNDYATSFDWFIRDFLSVKLGKIPQIGRVYDYFKNWVHESGDFANIEGVVADIFKFSAYYVNIALDREADPALAQAFRNISRLKVDVSYPFLLAVYEDYQNGIVSTDEITEIIILVENYVFRRLICGIPTNSLNKTFLTLYRSINKDAYLESLQAAFQLMDGYRRFPSDTEFETEILTKDVYNIRSRNYLLSKIENHNRKETVNVEDYTIEHIMPQNPVLNAEWQSMLGDDWKTTQERYLHTLGNLTLTRYNSELSDRPFHIKKTIDGGFDHSPVLLNQYLRTIDLWTSNEIVERAIQLAAKAKEVWSAPNLDSETLNKYVIVEPTSVGTFTSLDGHEYLENEMKDVFEALRKRVLNIDSSVREEFKRKYIAYKTSTNFLDIIPQKSRLILSLAVPYNELIDPRAVVRDVSEIGRWGNGYVEAFVSDVSELDYAMGLIEQAFDAQMNGAP